MWGRMSRQNFVARLLGCSAAALFVAAFDGPGIASAQNATTRPSQSAKIQHDEFVEDFQSGDAARIATALQGVRAFIRKHTSTPGEKQAMEVLMDGKRYADLETIALSQIIKDPSHTECVALLEKMRSQAFLAAGDNASALSAAKAYYNVASLKDTADTIDVVSLCLAAAHSEDSAIVQRFKEQQVAWATAAPTTQPDSTLGDPILPTITLDSEPFDTAINNIALSDYKQFVGKGNLLLVSGRAAEAHEVFNKAVPIAPAAKAGEAVESVARAIRAESCCIAPANAYILSLQGSK